MKKSIPLYQSLKFKVNLVAFIIFLVIIGLLLFKFRQDTLEIIDIQERNMNQIAVETIDRRFKVSYEILETGLSQVLANPAVAEAFAMRDRDTLSSLILPPYEKLESVGVTQFHFHLPDSTTFFRAHAPTLYGDDLSSLRKTIKTINTDPEHAAIKGLEEGVHGLSLRYIAPVYYEGFYIGSVELGMEVGQRILNIFSNVSGGDWYLYSFNESTQHLLHSTNSEDLYPLEMSPAVMNTLHEGHIIEESYAPYVVQVMPISDYEGNFHFYLKRIFDNSELISLQQQYFRNSLIYALGVAGAGSWLLWFVLRYLLNPLIYLENKVRKFEAGTLDETIDVNTQDEIGFLARAMETMRQSLLHREEKLKILSFHDSLTGVHNRHYMDSMIKLLDQQKAYPISILIADIDGLKQVNDEQGHPAGDAHLITSVQVMQQALRQSDHLCRVGGDEFALLLPQTDESVAKIIQERINDEIKRYNDQLKPGETPISISFGIATCEGNCNSLEEVMELADQRMYLNKHQKKQEKKEK